MNLPALQGHIPDLIYNQLEPLCSQFGIDGPLRMSHLIGQCQHESANFTHFVENLSYSGAALWSLFHTHFSSADEANTFAHQSERIANRIYSNRMGNGDEQSGDGWLYRGRGALQTTGHDNYKELGTFLSVDLLSNPDLVATDYIMASAAFFFKSNGLWSICDIGITNDVIIQITKRINGGVLGLSERIQYTTKFYNLLVDNV